MCHRLKWKPHTATHENFILLLITLSALKTDARWAKKDRALRMVSQCERTSIKRSKDGWAVAPGTSSDYDDELSSAWGASLAAFPSSFFL